MRSTLLILLGRLEANSFQSTKIISWSSPVPSFGDLSCSSVATLGLNPSNREFVDGRGNEIDGSLRRFHTLNSLGLSQWIDADEQQLQLIIESCNSYFQKNPYDGWFKKLNDLISGTKYSYYDSSNSACHLDLIPYATSCKWAGLTIQERAALLELTGDALALLLRDSPVRCLILNGRGVVEGLQLLSGMKFDQEEVPSWLLPRKSGIGVKGYAYKGVLTEISGIRLKRDIKILGFNHNIQSSFGVTMQIRSSIKDWLTYEIKEAL